MGRPYDPFSGLVSMLIVFALLAAIVGGTVVYIFLAVTGRLAPEQPLPPDESMTPEERVLTPGYGTEYEQEPDLPYPTPEDTPLYMQQASTAAADAWEGRRR